MMVAWDTIDGEYYPIFVMPGQVAAARQVAEFSINNDGSKLIAVYDFSLSLDEQLDERRAWHV